MTLSPGDTIQIILTVGGVPFAKTWEAGEGWDEDNAAYMCHLMYHGLCYDIKHYANETEST